MEENLVMESQVDIYNRYDYDKINTEIDVNNKLFCTFVTLEELEDRLKSITTEENVITYNVENANVSAIPYNTILVHRKKHTNTLYTINALNELIKKLNGGVVDTKFPIEWNHYRNTIMLTQQGGLKMLKTKIYQIIEL